MTFRYFLFILLALTLVPHPAAFAGNPGAGPGLFLHPGRLQYNLCPGIEILEDPEGKWSIEQVSSPEFHPGFKKWGHDVLSLVPSESYLWLRFTLQTALGPAPFVTEWFLELGNANLDEIGFYRPLAEAERNFELKQAGAMKPFAWREVDYRNFVFKLPHPSPGRTTYYLRIKSHAFLVVPVNLFTPDAFRRQAQADFFIFGLIYGALMAMTLYNAFIYLALKDRAYLLYLLFIVCNLAYFICLNGQIMYLFDPGLGNGLLILWLFLGGMIYFSTDFTRVFLNTVSRTPVLDKLLRLVQIMAVILVGLGLFRLNSLANQFAHFPGIIGPILGMAAGFLRWRQGYKTARFFLLAWSFPLVGIMLFALEGLLRARFFLPGPIAMCLGSTIGAILLSFALADRIRNLYREKEALARSRRHYIEASQTDGLTGLYNNRYYHTRIAAEVTQAKTEKRPLSLLILDIDNFKGINDAHGHAVGDKILIQLAGVLKNGARGSDAVCRYGGEEFAIILPGSNLKNAYLVAERIRQEFENRTFTAEGGVSFKATVSIGAAQIKDDEERNDLFRRADEALYQAKRTGKNMTIPSES